MGILLKRLALCSGKYIGMLLLVQGLLLLAAAGRCCCGC